MAEMAFQSKEEQERHQLYAEIERLREEIRFLARDRIVKDETGELRAEVERLKAENQRLLDWPDCEECDVPMLKRTLPGQEPVYFCAVCEAEAKLEQIRLMCAAYPIKCPDCGYEWRAGLLNLAATAKGEK